MDTILFAAIIAFAGGFGMLAGLSLSTSGRWPAWRNVAISVATMPVLFGLAFFLRDPEVGAEQYALILTSAQISTEAEKALKAALEDDKMTWSEYRSIARAQGTMSQEEMRNVAKNVTNPTKP